MIIIYSSILLLMMLTIHTINIVNLKKLGDYDTRNVFMFNVFSLLYYCFLLMLLKYVIKSLPFMHRDFVLALYCLQRFTKIQKVHTYYTNI